MKNIVWLASYPKSGNTWLRLFLANYLAGAKAPVPINKVENYATGDSDATLYRAAHGPAFNPLDDKASLQGRDAAFRLLSSNGADVNLVKTHNKNKRIGQLRLIQPAITRRAIYIIRNPLDVAVSYADHYGLTPEQVADEISNEATCILPSTTQVRQFNGAWSEHVKSWTQTAKFPLTVLRYEDMLKDPAAAFAKVMRDLGAPVDQARLDAAVTASSFDEARKQEDAGGFREKSPASTRFFRSGKTGEGEKVLSPETIDRIIADHRPVMKKFGYLT